MSHIYPLTFSTAFDAVFRVYHVPAPCKKTWDPGKVTFAGHLPSTRASATNFVTLSDSHLQYFLKSTPNLDRSSRPIKICCSVNRSCPTELAERCRVGDTLLRSFRYTIPSNLFSCMSLFLFACFSFAPHL